MKQTSPRPLRSFKSIKITKEEFVRRAYQVHGNQYDYSLVDYKNNKTKIKIICSKHGEFLQAPVNHINQKQGCKLCGIEKNSERFRSNIDEFKKRAVQIHQNKYDYSKVVYVGGHEKVVITCYDHGDFEQTPQSHLSGRRCPKCAKKSEIENRTIWTKEEIMKEIPKHDSISNFQKNASGAYAAAVRNGWWEEMKKKFVLKKRSWTKDEIQKIADTYLHRGKFGEENPAARKYAMDKGWYEDIVKHMVPVGNKYNRAVYAFEFSDKSVYVGLTGNLDRRKKSHTEEEENSAVKIKMSILGEKPEMKILSDGYIDYLDAQNMEGFMVSKYRDDGWEILNRTVTGSLGSCTRVWTLEILRELVKKYKSRSEFVENEPNAYAAAARNEWLDDIFQNMDRLINPNNTWTYEVVAKEAVKYNKKQDFAKGSPNAYHAARNNGWFKELTKNYTGGKKSWTPENLKIESSKYKTKGEFWKNAPSAAKSANKQGLMNLLFY